MSAIDFDGGFPPCDHYPLPSADFAESKILEDRQLSDILLLHSYVSMLYQKSITMPVYEILIMI
jgi:hypothetical protein